MTIPAPERVRELIERLRYGNSDGDDHDEAAAVLADWLKLATPPTCKRCGGPMLLLDGEWECHNVASAIAPAPSAQAKCETCKGRGEVGGHTGQTPESFEWHTEECPDCNGTGFEQPAPPSAQARASDYSGLDGLGQIAAEVMAKNDAAQARDTIRRLTDAFDRSNEVLDSAPTAPTTNDLCTTCGHLGVTSEGWCIDCDWRTNGTKVAFAYRERQGQPPVSAQAREALEAAQTAIDAYLNFAAKGGRSEERLRCMNGMRSASAVISRSLSANVGGGSGATSAVASQWRDIATAPRDGRNIMLATQHFVTEGYRHSDGEHRCCVIGKPTTAFTHWQPKPRPPAAPVSA